MICTSPFPHLIRDDWLDASELATVNGAWPARDWAGWHRYDHVYHQKATSDLTAPIPTAIAAILARLAAEPMGYFAVGAVPDLSLYGAGLHEIGSDGRVDTHLDAELHPRLNLARVVSALLYVHEEWQPGWGGELVLIGTEEANKQIEPRPGRLVAFATRGAWHAVEAVRCPVGHARRALALFWYAPLTGGEKRTTAHFGRQ